jgi:uncharacterized protein
MATRETAPIGAPCWIDLMTRDAQRTREFYGALFGWAAQDPNPEFGGYFNFEKDGAPIAGCMPWTEGMPGQPGIWSVYLASDDAAKTAELAAANGGHILAEPMQVGEMGTMAVLTDCTGAGIGVWQPGTHPGFRSVSEPNAPDWFELHTCAYDDAVRFYREVFRWTTHTMSDTPEFRYTVQAVGDDQLAGVMDDAIFAPKDAPSYWAVYFATSDADATLARIVELGGSVVQPAQDTPYGRLVGAVDPLGAEFKLRGPNIGS